MKYIELRNDEHFIGGHLLSHVIFGVKYEITFKWAKWIVIKDNTNKELWISRKCFKKHFRSCT